MSKKALLLSAVAVSSYSAEAQQFFDRLFTPPDLTRANLSAALIDALVTGGVWTKLDGLWIFAAVDASTSLVNLKSSSFSPAVATTGAFLPTFTVDVGWKCSGAATAPNGSYIDLSFNPSTGGGNYTRNDAMFCAWQLGTTTDIHAIVQDQADSAIELYTHYTDDHTYWMINNGTEISTVNSTHGPGFWLVERTGANASEVFIDNTSLATSANASAALVNQTIVFNLNGSGNNGAAVGIGASLTSGQKTTLRSALSTYLTAIGAI